MNKSILKSFFSSGLQAIAVQVLGVLFIAIVAKILPKDQFGIIQTSNAIAMFLTTLLGFGMEQVVVRRIAASSTSDWAASAFLFHNFIGSLVALGLTVLATFIFPDPEGVIHYLPLFFAAQAVIFLVTPLKQFLNAKHLFTPYGVVAVLSNVCKIVLAWFLISTKNLSITTTGSVLLLCASIELIALLIYVRAKTSFKLTFRFSAYKKLLRESMPQYISAVFDSSLSRLDIILLGFIGASLAATADYGIAYRAYEMARLPIVIVAPIILNMFAKSLSSGGRIAEDTQQQIKLFYTVEIFLAMLIPLILNILWSPLLNMFFDNKYGSSNEGIFLILSICIPVHFFINLMWTLSFAARKYKKIATVTMLTAILNLILNVILIKYYDGLGAAFAFLITTLFQATAYYLLVNKHLMQIPLFTLFRFLGVAAAIFTGVTYIDMPIILKVVVAIIAYVAINIATGWVNMSQLRSLKLYFKK